MKLLIALFMISIVTVTDNSNSPLAAEPVLQYLVRKPKIASTDPPLIILLHGIGSNEKDLFSFADQIPGNFLVISARAPYKLGNESYAWYHADFSTDRPSINKEEAEESRKTILRFIDQLKEKYHFDGSKVYLCGFSQGAILSYSVGLTRPDKIKAIAIMSGRILDDIKPIVASKDKLKHLAVFISHGSNDNVINVSNARESNAYLEHLGINATYKEYPDVHTINREMLADLINWLNRN